MRPSLHYIDRIHEKEKMKQRRLQNIQDQEDGVEEDVGRVVQVTMKKSTKETKLESSLRQLKEREAESWITLDLHTPESDFAQEKCELLLSSTTARIQTNSSQLEYLEKLQPKISGKHSVNVHDKIVRGMPLRDILAIQQLAITHTGEIDEAKAFVALGKQVRAILLNAQNVTFTQIVELLNPSLSDNRIIDALKLSSWLVNGQWVAKSHPEVVNQQNIEVQRIADEALKRMKYEVVRTSARNTLVPQTLSSVEAKRDVAGKGKSTTSKASSSASAPSAIDESEISTEGALPVEIYPVIGDTATDQLKTLLRSLVSQNGVASKTWLHMMVGRRSSDT
ncbi:hypothetical protein HK096_009409, partial [Nowakowskiella sp. JEL0078]